MRKMVIWQLKHKVAFKTFWIIDNQKDNVIKKLVNIIQQQKSNNLLKSEHFKPFKVVVFGKIIYIGSVNIILHFMYTHQFEINK